MSDSYDEIEARIQPALATISFGEKPNIAALVHDYAVPEFRPFACYKGRTDKSNCGGAGRSLSRHMEEVENAWIQSQLKDKRGQATKSLKCKIGFYGSIR